LNFSGMFFCWGTLCHNTSFSSYSGHQTMLEMRNNCPHKFCGPTIWFVHVSETENLFEGCHFKEYEDVQNNVTTVFGKNNSSNVSKHSRHWNTVYCFRRWAHSRMVTGNFLFQDVSLFSLSHLK
jgi:hypothetical protein